MRRSRCARYLYRGQPQLAPIRASETNQFYKLFHLGGGAIPADFGKPEADDGRLATMDIAEFLRGKASDCRALSEQVADSQTAVRGLLALALELDAQAVAIEAGRATAREIEAGDKDGEGDHHAHG
jgi:hypothetical protein